MNNLNEDELAKYVGEKIRQFRKQKKMTQKDLGDAIGVKHNTISNYETGTISPEQDMLYALSRALDVSMDDLFPEQENEYKAVDNVYDMVSESKELGYEDLALIKQITEKALKLEGEERKKLMNNIKLAVNLFDESDK